MPSVARTVQIFETFVCPHCGASHGRGPKAGADYQCLRCGYVGPKLADPAAPRRFGVLPGDTLTRFASRHGVDLASLLAKNRRLRPLGEEIRLCSCLVCDVVLELP